MSAIANGPKNGSRNPQQLRTTSPPSPARVAAEARHVRDRERPEERQPEPEATAHHLVHLLRRREPLLHATHGLQKERVLDAVGDEPGPAANDRRALADGPGQAP